MGQFLWLKLGLQEETKVGKTSSIDVPLTLIQPGSQMSMSYGQSHDYQPWLNLPLPGWTRVKQTHPRILFPDKMVQSKLNLIALELCTAWSDLSVTLFNHQYLGSISTFHQQCRWIHVMQAMLANIYTSVLKYLYLKMFLGLK